VHSWKRREKSLFSLRVCFCRWDLPAAVDKAKRVQVVVAVAIVAGSAAKEKQRNSVEEGEGQKLFLPFPSSAATYCQ
jgi:hypothetical protein